MRVSPVTIASLVIAISFAAGLNVYATTLTLGAMARLHWIELPSGLNALANWWVIGASGLLFSAEFVADKIPGFDLVWNAAHTFVRIPVALLLAYGATSHLSPEMQMMVTILGGAIAAVAHGSKLAVRGAATASPEPFSNAVLSTTEDALAVGLTWAATRHPVVAGSIAAVLVLTAAIMMRIALRSIRRFWQRLTQRSRTKAVMTAGITVAFLILIPRDLLSGQMLARPGWTASSATAPASWNHAVMYEIDTRSFQDSDGDGVGDLKGIAQHLDYLQRLGVDAILIDSLGPAATAPGRSPTAPIDPALGTIDDFDALSLEASRHNLRILLELAKPNPALARFWLTRGVAGFRIRGQADAAGMQALRKMMTGYAGRILIADAGSANAPAGSKARTNELVLDTDILRLPELGGAGGTAHATAQLRGALDHAQSLLHGPTPVLATDGQGVPRDVDRFREAGHGGSSGIARIMGTVLLLNRSAALIYAGQELGLSSESPDGKPEMMPWGPPPVPAAPPPPQPKPAQPADPEAYVPYVPPPAPPKPVAPDPASAAGQELDPNSVLNFYRQLILLHHGNTALRDGEQITLNHDGESALVWVRRPPSPSYQNPAIVIVCNLSDKPSAISLKADLTRLHLRGSFLRKLLRSDGGLGSMDVDPTSVPPFGVYVGELKF